MPRSKYPFDTLDNNQLAKIQRGFTLIEVLIVVAIIGILTAIAYPQYGEYVTKARRSDGHLALLQAVQSLERCKSTNYSYATCALPSASSPEGYYTLSLVNDATSYTITATGILGQAKDTACNAMTVNHQDTKTPAASEKCWPN